MSYFYIFLTIALTVYGQLIIKWQVGLAGELPELHAERLSYLIRVLSNPWILSGFIAAFLASVTWIGAISKLPLSYAYPFVSSAFVVVMLSSGFLFNETITPPKIIGMVCIVAGIAISSYG